MKISTCLIFVMLLFVGMTGCQSQSQHSIDDYPPGIDGEIPPPASNRLHEDNNGTTSTLNTGKVDQMILNGIDPKEALAELNKLEKDIKNDQQLGIFHVRRAEILINMGENQKAIDEFEEVLKINSKPLSRLLACSYIASINNNLGNREEALLYMEKAQEIYPEIKDDENNPRILIYFVSNAVINSDRGNFEDVIKDLNAANSLINKYHLSNHEYRESIILERAFAYSMLKQPEKARETIKNWSDADKAGKTSNPPINKNLDDLEIRYKVAIAKGEYENALKCTEEINNDDKFLFHLARGYVYYAWDKNDEARKEFELASKESKDNIYRKQALKMLEKLK